jgi:hypothetical protein
MVMDPSVARAGGLVNAKRPHPNAEDQELGQFLLEAQAVPGDTARAAQRRRRGTGAGVHFLTSHSACFSCASLVDTLCCRLSHTLAPKE